MAVSAKDLIHAPIQEVSERIRKKEVSPVEITDLMLARVDELDSRINAFIHLFRDEVRSDAKRAEEEIRRGQYRGPLHGIPIGIKDIYESGPTTCGSKALRGLRDAARLRLRAQPQAGGRAGPGQDAHVRVRDQPHDQRLLLQAHA